MNVLIVYEMLLVRSITLLLYIITVMLVGVGTRDDNNSTKSSLFGRSWKDILREFARHPNPMTSSVWPSYKRIPRIFHNSHTPTQQRWRGKDTYLSSVNKYNKGHHSSCRNHHPSSSSSVIIIIVIITIAWWQRKMQLKRRKLIRP